MAKPKQANTEALRTFTQRKLEIDQLLQALQTHSDEHCGLTPEEVHWGHVGDLDEWLNSLRRIARHAGLLPHED